MAEPWADRPRVGDLVVPYMVPDERRPIDFKALDADHVARCAKEGRCGICGRKIRSGPIAFIGPDDGRTCFADPWMHPPCARLAMGQCPFLARGKDWREGGEDPLLARYAGHMVLYEATGWSSHRDQLGAWHFEATHGLRRDDA